MYEQLLQTLPVALRAGISYTEFWELTPKEIIFICREYNKYEQETFIENFKIRAQERHNLAVMIGNAMVGKVGYLWDYYPDLFDNERAAFISSQLKAKIMNAAHAWRLGNKEVKADGTD